MENLDANQPKGQEDDYTIFVSQAILLMTGAKNGKSLVDSLKGTKDLQQIANVMIGIINRVEDQGRQKGINFSKEVLFHGSQEILIALLTKANIELTQEEANQVVAMMIGGYMKQAISAGKLTKEQAGQWAEQAKQYAGQQSQPQGLLGGSNG